MWQRVGLGRGSHIKIQIPERPKSSGEKRRVAVKPYTTDSTSIKYVLYHDTVDSSSNQYADHAGKVHIV